MERVLYLNVFSDSGDALQDYGSEPEISEGATERPRCVCGRGQTALEHPD